MSTNERLQRDLRLLDIQQIGTNGHVRSSFHTSPQPCAQGPHGKRQQVIASCASLNHMPVMPHPRQMLLSIWPTRQVCLCEAVPFKAGSLSQFDQMDARRVSFWSQKVQRDLSGSRFIDVKPSWKAPRSALHHGIDMKRQQHLLASSNRQPGAANMTYMTAVISHVRPVKFMPSLSILACCMPRRL